MIVSAYYAFIGIGGQTAVFNTKAIYPYILAMIVYFLINVISFGLYYLIKFKENFFHIVKGIFKESISAYLSTLLLSLMLTTMFQTNYYFSLFIFVCISALLSVAFKQLFNLYQEVSEKSIRDQRTGLYNHGYFEDILEKELVQAKSAATSFSLVILDVDNFKKYNDTFGHLKGDLLLGFFGALLLKNVNLLNLQLLDMGEMNLRYYCRINWNEKPFLL